MNMKMFKIKKARIFPITLMIILVMSVLTGIFILSPSETADPSNWSYYKIITINNPVDGFYQFGINISKENGLGDVDCEGHCDNDLTDIRFYDNDNSTQLYYWIEDNSTTTTGGGNHYAYFWVNVTSNQMTDGEFLMYYGNAGVGVDTTYHNGTNTFIFFDDFSDGPDFTNDWESGAQGNFTTSGGLLEMTIPSDSDDALFTKDSFGTVTAEIVTRMDIDPSDETDTYFSMGTGPSGAGAHENNGGYSIRQNVASDFIRARVDGSNAEADWTPDTNWYRGRNMQGSTSNCTVFESRHWDTIYENGGTQTTIQGTAHNSSGHFELLAYGGDGTSYVQFFIVYNATVGDTVSLSFGSELTGEVSSEMGILDTLDGGYVTWTGEEEQAGQTIYTNETGSTGKNVTIYTTMNVSEDCIDIFVDLSGDTTLGDSNEIDFDSSSGNSDMYLQISRDDDWDSSDWLQFTDANNYNISLNTSWTSICNDPNPFELDFPAGNITIYCIFRLDITPSLSSGTYSTVNNNVWKIVHKTQPKW